MRTPLDPNFFGLFSAMFWNVMQLWDWPFELQQSYRYSVIEKVYAHLNNIHVRQLLNNYSISTSCYHMYVPKPAFFGQHTVWVILREDEALGLLVIVYLGPLDSNWWLDLAEKAIPVQCTQLIVKLVNMTILVTLERLTIGERSPSTARWFHSTVKVGASYHHNNTKESLTKNGQTLLLFGNTVKRQNISDSRGNRKRNFGTQ